MAVTLEQIKSCFNQGQTVTMKQLADRFKCEPVDVMQHLTRRNGFVQRVEGKRTFYDMNPLLSEIASPEAATNGAV